MTEKTRTIRIRLTDRQGETVARADKSLDEVQGVSIFIHKGKNYAFHMLEGKFLTDVVFSEAGTVEEF